MYGRRGETSDSQKEGTSDSQKEGTEVEIREQRRLGKEVVVGIGQRQEDLPQGEIDSGQEVVVEPIREKIEEVETGDDSIY